MSATPPIESKYEHDPSYRIGTGPVYMDRSHVSETYKEILCTTAAVPGGGIGPNNYNGVEAIFEKVIDGNTRIALDRSYIAVTGYAAHVVGGVETVLPAGVSIPWHAPAAMLDKFHVCMNDKNEDIETVETRAGDALMAKTLLTYPRDVIEAMDDEFFTPCIEGARDLVNQLSNISTDRATANLRNDTLHVPLIHTKVFHLRDLFESMRAPAYYRISKLQLYLTFRAKNAILIGTTAAIPDCYYFITDIRLYLCYVTMTGEQMNVERARLESHASIFRETYIHYDPQPTSNIINPKDSSVRNLQGCVFMIPSTDALDALGCNRLQYVHAGITGIQYEYMGVKSPDFKVQIDLVNAKRNAVLYEQYRTLAGKMNERELPLAIGIYHMSNFDTGTGHDLSPYVLHCASFFPRSAYYHATADGSELSAIIDNASTRNVVYVRIRVRSIEMRGDTDVIAPK